MDELGEKPVEAAFAGYYNMDMQNMEVEIGFVMTKHLPGKGEIKAGEIPAGRQLSYLFKGPYKEVAPVYDAMMKWVQENGYTPTGVAYEFYYNSPQEVPESELLTKIIFPLKKQHLKRIEAPPSKRRGSLLKAL
ncbi:MAG TPA: GyrI-like domain-containing protein [Bacillota bacterium]|nr:GyrI-like domain-containing protein [Bacillota bacterium]HOL15543.1 GyrI-like domain-containing protein [Bacillota bacterium]